MVNAHWPRYHGLAEACRK